MSIQTKITAFFKQIDSNDSSLKRDEKTFCDSKHWAQMSAPKKDKKDQANVKRSKECPFYKKIPNTSFAVDAFSYNQIPNIHYYFLSHFHFDHYQGLKRGFNYGKIVCSSITGRLIMNQLGVQSKFIQIVDICNPTLIENIQVVLIDANHCPGAVIFLFIFPNGYRVLHTGDFRFNHEMESNHFLKHKRIDCIYLDTTYLDPRYSFPKQEDILNLIVNLAQDELNLNSRTLIVCGSYTIGKEKVFQAISQHLNLKIYVSSDKLKILNCLDNSLSQSLTIDKSQAQIHVLSMNELNISVRHWRD